MQVWGRLSFPLTPTECVHNGKKWDLWEWH